MPQKIPARKGGISPLDGVYSSRVHAEPKHFLARLHPYRNEPNSSFAFIGGSLSEMQFYLEAENEPCLTLHSHVGKGDVLPLLERPALS